MGESVINETGNIKRKVGMVKMSQQMIDVRYDRQKVLQLNLPERIEKK